MSDDGTSVARTWPLGAICFLFCVAIALPGLGNTMFDPKEGDLVAIGARPFADLWSIGFKNQSHGWPLLMHFWVKIGGSGEWWTRLLSVLVSSLGAFWLFKLGELLLSRRVGVAAALTYAVIPSSVWHMREARMYGLFSALTLGALYYALAWERSGDRRALAGAVACSLASAYVHFFGIGVAGAVVGYLCIGAALRGGGSRGPWLRGALSAGAATGVLLIPQLVRVRAGMKYSGGPNAKYGLSGEWFDATQRIGRSMWAQSVKLPGDWPALASIILAVALLIFVIGVFQLGRDDTPAVPIWWTRLALLVFVFGAGIGFIVLASRSDVRARYFSFLAGPIALGIGAAVATPRKRWWFVAWPLAIFLLVPSVASLKRQRSVDRGDLEGVLAVLAEQSDPGDTVLAVPSFAANLVRLKTGRDVNIRKFLTREVQRGHLALATDTIWIVHVASQGGDPQTDFLDRNYRLVEQHVGPKSFLQRWSRSARDAGRQADFERVASRAPEAPGQTRVALTGWWRGTDVPGSSLGRQLDAASDLTVVRGFRPKGGTPDVSLEPAKLRLRVRGPGWRLHSVVKPAPRDGAPAVVVAALDMENWKYRRIPPKALVELELLKAEGAVVLRIIPPKPAKKAKAAEKGKKAQESKEAKPLALARQAARMGVRVVTVDGLSVEEYQRIGDAVVLPDLGVFSNVPGRSHLGRLALVTLSGEGVVHADLLPTTSARNGEPRVDGMGILHVPPKRRSKEADGKARTVAFQGAREGTGASLLDLYPGSARAEEDRVGGSFRECRPLDGRTFLYNSERGPGNIGGLTDRLSCSTVQLKTQWQGAARAEHFLDGESRDCLWLHPTGQEPMRLVFDDVPLGSRLQGRIGVTDTAAKKAKGLVDFEVRVNGVPVHRSQAGRARGWNGWAADTRRFRGRTHQVEFRVTTKKPRWRHFCFDAEVLP